MSTHSHHLSQKIHSSQEACDLIFEHLKEPDANNVEIDKLFSAVKNAGILLTDPRLKETMEKLKKYQSRVVLHKSGSTLTSTQLDLSALAEIINENIVMLYQIVQNDFIIPNFQAFCHEIDRIYERCRENTGGEVATYITQLARFSPKYWGVSVCTVDGQRYFVGDTSVPFCLQSTSKPFNYALALTELGPEVVHEYVGFEPSGVSCSTICLNQAKRPYNPLINAGAIVICSLIKQRQRLADRFDYVMEQYRRMAGNEHLGFSNSTFLSERETADRNFALGYYMKEYGCFPPNCDIMETLDFYFQLCSVEATCESSSVMVGTLANGGICPLSGQRVFSPEAVRDTLSLMHSCGMSDYSGQFAFKCGLPAKSGVSGAILLVVPNVMGLCLWSPPLDKHDNSVRGLQFCAELVEYFHLHNFDSLLHRTSDLTRQGNSCDNHSIWHRISCPQSSSSTVGKPGALRPTWSAQSTSSNVGVMIVLFSAFADDLVALRRVYIAGFDMECADYDSRTALHVAAAEGHVESVGFLLRVCGVDPNPSDRWGFRPLDEAERFGKTEVAKLLRESGAVAGKDQSSSATEGAKVTCKYFEE